MRKEEKRRTNPLVGFDVEVVERDMSGGEENLVDEWIDSLEHSEIQHLRALLIQIRRQFLGMRHLSFAQTLQLTRLAVSSGEERRNE